MAADCRFSERFVERLSAGTAGKRLGGCGTTGQREMTGGGSNGSHINLARHTHVKLKGSCPTRFIQTCCEAQCPLPTLEGVPRISPLRLTKAACPSPRPQASGPCCICSRRMRHPSRTAQPRSPVWAAGRCNLQVKVWASKTGMQRRLLLGPSSLLFLRCSLTLHLGFSSYRLY